MGVDNKTVGEVEAKVGVVGFGVGVAGWPGIGCSSSGLVSGSCSLQYKTHGQKRRPEHPKMVCSQRQDSNHSNGVNKSLGRPIFISLRMIVLFVTRQHLFLNGGSKTFEKST